MLRTLSSFLTDRSIKVKVDEMISETVLLNAGTPQGSVLSPILFIIYVNDVPVLDTSNLSQYADDVGFYVQNKAYNFVKLRLQRQIELLEKWCNKWHIKLNPAKTKLLVISPKKRVMKVTMYGQIITECSEAELLGTTIDKKLSTSSHITKLKGKVTRRMNSNCNRCPCNSNRS